jgi:mono/diheme cytochrome c family protein
MLAGRMLLRTLHVAIAICAVGPAAHAQRRATIGRGQEIAARMCAGCHAMGGQQGSVIQGTPVPSFVAIAGRPNLTPERLHSLIMTPRHPMPATPLTMAEINDVVAYLLSLR